MPKSQNTKVTTEPEISGNGMGHSNAEVGGGASASSAELSKALELVLARNAQLEADLAAAKAGSDGIDKLVNALSQIVPKNTDQNLSDGINRTADFKGTKATVDGRSLIEAQQTLQEFRNEPRHPISISKALASSVGADLPITVNGVRISIPCDGKTYYINETHWEHARERLAKLDALTAKTEPQVIEINA